MHRAHTTRLSLLVSAWVLVTVAGCHQDDQTPINLEPSASARVLVALPRSLPLASVSRVVATVTPAGGAPVQQELSGTGASWQGLVRRVHSGAGATVEAEAFDAQGTAVALAQVSEVSFAKHRSGLIVLVPRAQSQGEPPGNVAPFIDAVVGSTADPRPGAALSLRAVAGDANTGDTVSYAWRATGGTFSGDTTPTPVWTAPTEIGAVTLTLQVTDSHGAAATLDFVVGVNRTGAGPVDGQAVLNRWPALSELTAQPSEEVSEGTPVSLRAVSVDEDGDVLRLQWQASCEGTFDDATAAQASFTPTALPAGACNNCKLTLSVSDGFGGAREGSVDLCVVRKLPPVIVSTSQSSEGTTAGDLVRLVATAEDPQHEPLTFTWTASTGLLGPPAKTGGTGEVDWTALSCLPADVVPTVQLTVTNRSGLSDSHTFTVAWNGGRCGQHPPCSVTLEDAKVTMQADCTTESTVFIPDGYTFDGAGHVLTAVDPEGGRFLGAVLRNRGAEADVRALKVEGRSLTGAGKCDGGEDALAGIRLMGASGSVVDSEVRDLFQAGGNGGCQEGTAIEVRNAPGAASVLHVDVLRNRVAGYQKAGIVASGRLDVRVEGNTVEGGGPLSVIARNGIQVSSGATGRVTGNTVTGHSYTGPGYVASGILVAGGPYYGNDVPLSRDVVIRNNTLADNDVGINLAQAAADGGPLPESTRIQVVDNTLSSAALTNGYPYQAGISDYGGGNVISRNHISGAGYDRATSPGVTFDVDVVAGAAARVVFLTEEQHVAAGACSGELVVQSQDAVGNLSALTTPTLVAEAAGVTFYADAACTQALPASGAGAELKLEAPQQEARFFFLATQTGTVTVSVTGDGVSASQSQTVE
ncbi:right-handed parallel beta-helix repeat-containing protein [Pyxidicoccus parkwayensis]|uniref:Right-handed parallel beta-helix repeat-containing protein n=1 Tax=Pyxidicoccus parkwayensis TaxID=2813578 RepID=A0ABX7NUU7_9BACT|nr:right-handed parallel beta-helix repeat-containing protein [Pyxidicoccus parkwaysis]QSQ21265.1 right-handed parallel beta-helix repeat-containing protein [Pyxidicoccus parkwaysis]